MRESNVKDKILEVASRLFYDQGYNLTGINQIIEEADIARASLYNHFGSKTELLMAYLEKTRQSWFTDLDEFLRPVTDPREKILALFDFRIARQERLDFKGCHFSKIGAEASQREEPVFVLVRNHKEKIRHYISELVLRLKDGKQPQTLSNELLTDTIFLLFEGGLAIGAVYHSSQPLQNAKKIVDTLI